LQIVPEVSQPPVLGSTAGGKDSLACGRIAT